MYCVIGFGTNFRLIDSANLGVAWLVISRCFQAEAEFNQSVIDYCIQWCAARPIAPTSRPTARYIAPPPRLPVLSPHGQHTYTALSWNRRSSFTDGKHI